MTLVKKYLDIVDITYRKWIGGYSQLRWSAPITDWRDYLGWNLGQKPWDTAVTGGFCHWRSPCGCNSLRPGKWSDASHDYFWPEAAWADGIVSSGDIHARGCTWTRSVEYRVSHSTRYCAAGKHQNTIPYHKRAANRGRQQRLPHAHNAAYRTLPWRRSSGSSESSSGRCGWCSHTQANNSAHERWQACQRAWAAREMEWCVWYASGRWGCRNNVL